MHRLTARWGEMGRRRLAYMIHKKTEATYHNFLFRGDGKCVAEVERKLPPELFRRTHLLIHGGHD